MSPATLSVYSSAALFARSFRIKNKLQFSERSRDAALKQVSFYEKKWLLRLAEPHVSEGFFA